MLDKRSLSLTGVLCAAALSLGACSGQDESKNGRGAPEVGYVAVKAEPVPVTSSLGGRTVAFETTRCSLPYPTVLNLDWAALTFSQETG